MKTIVKKLIGGSLTGLGADSVSRVRHRSHSVVLAYHNIVPRGESTAGDESLHLPQEDFARQLDVLMDTHEVVSVSSLFAERDSNRGGKPRMRAALTFDDAYRGALTAGLREVVRREIPATIFVSPVLLGERAFWWDVLSSEKSGTVDASLREFCLSRLNGDQKEILAWADEEGLLTRTSVPDHARPGTVELIRIAAKQPQITLGMHGWLHLSLPSCSSEKLRRELDRPLKWFSELDIPHRRWLAYPYGRFSEDLSRAAGDKYSLAFTTSGKMVSDDSGRTAIPRVNIPAGISLDYFRLRTSGLLNLLRL